MRFVLLLIVLASCQQLSVLEEASPLEEIVTAEQTFTFYPSAQALQTQALPDGVELTLQVVTTTSASKPGWKQARGKYKNTTSTTQNLNLVTEVTANFVPIAEPSLANLILEPKKTAFRASKAAPSHHLVCARVLVNENGVDNLMPYEVCETPVSLEQIRATLESKASLADFDGQDFGVQHFVWSGQTPEFNPTDGISFETWVKLLTKITSSLTEAQKTKARAWSVFAQEIRRFAGTRVSISIEEVPCHNCHEWVVTLVGQTTSGTFSMTLSYGWDS